MKMKFLIFISCILGVQCFTRDKRIVNGSRALIPPYIDLESNIPDSTGPYNGSLKNEEINKLTNGGYNDIEVIINDEFHSAKVIGVKERDGCVSFKGIRFAEPPVGRKRFVRPVLRYLNGEVIAKKYGSPCVQLSSNGKIGEEDCLFLNVFTPSEKATGLPVLFWIHGGNFKLGSGNQYGVTHLMSKNIVVVTINYRLGTLGFLGSNSQLIPGNAGLFDIRSAFEWTRKYISHFGGDSNKIFPAGQGSGASVATLVAQSSFTSSFVKGVIALSGTSISSNVIDHQPTDTFNAVVEATQCSNLSPLETVNCLQKSDVDAILMSDELLMKKRAGDSFLGALTSLFSSGPLVEGKDDGRFLPFFLNDDPLEALQEKKYSKVPLLTGTTKEETGKLILGKFKEKVEMNQEDVYFLSESLPKSLLINNKGLYLKGDVNELLKLLYQNNDYQNLILSTVATGDTSFLTKVIKETTDALFNLPAITESTLWENAGGHVYYYSLEESPLLASPVSFLDAIPLYYSQPADKVVGHGDDLLYLFELQTLEGYPIPTAELTHPKDIKVREIFLDLIAEFLSYGKLTVPETNQNWPTFGYEQNYVTISSQPELKQKFRYCEVALWGAFVDKLTDPSCNFPQIWSILNTIPNINELLKTNLFIPNTTVHIQESRSRGYESVQPFVHLRLTLIGG